MAAKYTEYGFMTTEDAPSPPVLIVGAGWRFAHSANTAPKNWSPEPRFGHDSTECLPQSGRSAGTRAPLGAIRPTVWLIATIACVRARGLAAGPLTHSPGRPTIADTGAAALVSLTMLWPLAMRVLVACGLVTGVIGWLCLIRHIARSLLRFVRHHNPRYMCQQYVYELWR
jgi:hypothetical protein